MTTAKGWAPHTATARAVAAAGFFYDPAQDIIYSRMDAWQRAVGFNWVYDLAAAGMSMIIDCETIYFTSGGKRWLIELWKGQYGLETGCEIGVYNHVNAHRPNGSDRGAHYLSASNVDIAQLTLSFTLKRHGKVLFRRGPEHHWWLTGFKWGVFTEHTSDLTMDVVIEFHPLLPFLPTSDDMRLAFVAALKKLGYRPATMGRRVSFQFTAAKTPPPSTRTRNEQSVQTHNAVLVDKYNALKADLGLRSNDPNGFHFPEAAAVVRPVVRPLVGQVVKKIGEKVGEKIDANRKRLEHDAARHQREAHDVFACFHHKVWRSAHR